MAKKRTPSASPWVAADFAGIFAHYGAIKLASTAVAPPVGAARGRTSAAAAASAEDFATHRNVGDSRFTSGRHEVGV